MARMSSLENIYLKMSSPLEPAALGQMTQHQPQLNGQRQIGREVAHELNNILTIIRGYADRMLLKHGENDSLRPELKLIAESAKRAECVIRNSPRSHASPAA
jgi:signal transduction histidine kinase